MRYIVAERTDRNSIRRRDLLAGMLNLAWIAPLVISLGQVVRFLRFNPPDSGITRFPLSLPGALTAFPVYLEQGRVWLMRDTHGLYALDAVCTHLGCIVGRDETDAGFKCPCHGSRFSADGGVLNGPASQPLRYLQLAQADDGQIVVDRSKPVDPSFRLAAS
jgi:cytochrome b6-f complex iron-sulfur subunit